MSAQAWPSEQAFEPDLKLHMRIAVIGAGLLGVTTAWFLAESGNEVVVIDREIGPGLETSFANGGMLTPSQASPWNTPGIALQVLKWLGRADSPFLLKPSQLGSLLGWGTAFLRHSSPARFSQNHHKNVALARYSLGVLGQVRQRLDIKYDQSTLGTMKVYRTDAALHEAITMMEQFGVKEIKYSLLDQDAVISHEPALHAVKHLLAGGLYFPDDEAGDAHQFCRELALATVRKGVSFHYGTNVTGLVRSANRIKAIKTSAGDIEADVYVLAAGSYSPLLARSVDIHLPIYPVKGYSLTVEVDSPAAALPLLPVIDELRHIAVTPLGNRLRIAGKAELAGYDQGVDEKRIRSLLKFFGQMYPELGRRIVPATIKKWSGLRPYCCDGVPILGSCQIDNLVLNTGHGHLGWTLAAGSARLIADFINTGKTTLDLAPYLLSRFH